MTDLQRELSGDVAVPLALPRSSGRWWVIPSAWRAVVWVGATIAGSVVFIGAQHVWAICAFSGLAFVSAAAALRRRSWELPATALVLLALALLCGLQAVPLPLAALETLSPRSAEIWRRAYEVNEVSRTWAAISLSPSASIIEALKWSAYAAMCVAGALVTKRHGLRPVALLVFGTALLVATITLAHGALGMKRLYGFHTPSFDPGPWGVGPLLNDNNRAGYFNLGAFAGLSLVASHRLQAPRWAIAIGVSLLVGMSLLSGSRGGVAALVVVVVALTVVAGQRAWQRRAAPRRRGDRATLVLAAALGLGALFALIGAGEAGIRHLVNDESLEKLTVQTWTAPMLKDYAITGVGRGAFETVFPEYRMHGGRMLHQFAENFVVQWAVEWGPLVGVSAVAALGWWLRPRSGDLSESKFLRVALAVVVLQNLVDLALELPAVGLAVAAVIGALSAEVVPTVTVRASRLRGALASAVGLGLVVSVAVTGRPTAMEARAELNARRRELPAEDHGERAQLLSDVRREALRFPADPFLPLLASLLSSRSAPQQAMRWVAWALERDMMSGRAHLALADLLMERHARNQALLELRYAVEREPALSPRVERRALRWGKSVADLLRAVPDGPSGAVLLLELGREPRLATSRLELLALAVERDPSLDAVHDAYGNALIDALAGRQPPCDDQGAAACIKAAEAQVRALTSSDPKHSRGLVLQARLLAGTGHLEDGLALLRAQCSRHEDAVGCWRVLIHLTPPGPMTREFDDALKAFFAVSCSSSEGCAQAARVVAAQLESRSDYLGAMGYYARAIHEVPSAVTWLDLARAARLAGQNERAREALKRARELAPDDATRQLAERQARTLPSVSGAPK